MHTKLRPAQAEILKYNGGRMAISAVPGSGKTFTLSLLAAQLIQDGRLDIEMGQQILIVTYLNASVDTFRANIRRRLDEVGLPAAGFDVRTLHSLALEIVRLATSSLGEDSSAPLVQDANQSSHALALAVDGYIESNPSLWHAFLPDDSPQMHTRWRNVTQSTAQTFIRAAKNARYRPEQILDQLSDIAGSADTRSDRVPLETDLSTAVAQSPLLHMMAGIYFRYQGILTRQAVMDFDDLIWQAADLIEQRPQLAAELRQRWPYVLEDEAQDSVPLQETLIQGLTGSSGNWIRVGDPNQAITSTFTAAHPRFFNQFIDRPDVISLPLPNSGRCAPRILGAANTLLHWGIDEHPVAEVRQNAFRRQEILPTPPGDGQPNPSDHESDIRIKVYKHREEDELPSIARAASAYARSHPDHTLAILVPTNQIGYEVAQHLDDLEADYDNLLREGSQQREIAAAIHAILSVLVNPLSNKALVAAHASLFELEHPAVQSDIPDLDQLHVLLRSVHRPESLLFPWSHEEFQMALPDGIATEAELIHIHHFTSFLGRVFEMRPLPIDDLVLALGDELFGWGEVNEVNVAIAYQMAAMMRHWRESQPEWRLPELVAQLQDVVEGRQRLPVTAPTDLGYEPQPGRITLTTQHSAKGLEWDGVFLLGIDGFWIPGSLEATFLGVHDFLGGDPVAEVIAQLNYLMIGQDGLFAGRTATESAHIEVICERLRLLYVGITRARRYLHLSRSRATRHYNKDREAQPATVLGVLYHFVKTLETEKRSHEIG